MKTWIKRIGLVLLIITAVVFWGRWLLDLFGIVKYALPLNQDVENIVQIELLENADSELTVLCTLTDHEMDAFLQEFMQIEAGRHANDPPTQLGKRAVKVYYSDGDYDILGQDMIIFFSASGEILPTNGWYYLPIDALDSLFEKYVKI